MSEKRHADEPLLRGYAVTHPAGRTALPVHPGWDRLVYTAAGTLSVRAGARLWTVPPHRALWLPDGVAAGMHNRYPAAVRVLYFAVRLGAARTEPGVLALTGFPRELLLHVVRVCPLDDADRGRAALLTVLLDQLRALPAADLDLAVPHDPDTGRAADLLRAEPGIAVGAVARTVGLSVRTLERRFRAETGMTLGAWRRRARILDTLEPLAAGVSVTRAGADAGYSTPSAFVAAFTRELGAPPRGFLRSG
ncbi:helix-turn-helix domain-containing protein [Nocardia asteroides]|uniref:helix-turn-helix domain-containing protein n=1 Tax=Nocardia asteroides TaxID=1824 RepID=UPI001E55019F|nr:helix-turn-helix transcriptional regulator [Nocardia asteroides]UGT62977.1 helix-turn-helix transcriptional regulator [Nocardia asteroides]